MRHRMMAAVAAALLLSASALGAAAQPIPARRDTTLAWDDGEYVFGEWIMGVSGMQLAVMFQAPEWSSFVTEIEIFAIFEEDPAVPFLAHVWKPTDDSPPLPGNPAMEPVYVGWGSPGASWIPVVLPEPVNIEDPAAFPERRFFVGMEWLAHMDPHVGMDMREPVYQMGWEWNFYEWEHLTLGDAMVRAVVGDSTATSVEPRSWGTVKALYR